MDEHEQKKIKNREYGKAYRERQKQKGLRTYNLRSEMTEDEKEKLRERQRRESQKRKERGWKRNLNKELLAKREAKYKALRHLRKKVVLSVEDRAKIRAKARAKYLANRESPEFMARQNERARILRAKMRAQGKKTYKPYTEEQKAKQRERARIRRLFGIDKAFAKQWREKNRKKISDGQKNWRLQNLDKSRVHARVSAKKRRLTPWGRINNNLWTTLHDGMKGGRPYSKYHQYLGYTWIELKNHLMNLFKDGMTWELLCLGEIHIDHIKPLKLFRYESLDDPLFKEAWALSNLQPLWKVDNLRKSCKYNP